MYNHSHTPKQFNATNPLVSIIIYIAYTYYLVSVCELVTVSLQAAGHHSSEESDRRERTSKQS